MHTGTGHGLSSGAAAPEQGSPLPIRFAPEDAGYTLWTLAVQPGFIALDANHGIFVSYPVIPWLSIMLTGYGTLQTAQQAMVAGANQYLRKPPDIAELIEAVREFLETDVMGSTEGRVRFHARVAANALAIVERELAAGTAAADGHGWRLAALGVADDAQLAGAIRAGDLDDRWDDVVTALAASSNCAL